MENSSKSHRIHPLIAGAAVAVTLVSLVGVAALTGLIPNSQGSNAPQISNVAPVALTPNGMDIASESPASVPRTREPVRVHHSENAVVAQTAAVCSNCGRVEAVNAIRHEPKGSGVGVVAGALLGGVLGNQVGGGNGRKLATVAGAVGGGYAGNEVEKNHRATTSYEVRVRMDNGTVRIFPYASSPGYGAGDRVRVVNGHLVGQG